MFVKEVYAMWSASGQPQDLLMEDIINELIAMTNPKRVDRITLNDVLVRPITQCQRCRHTSEHRSAFNRPLDGHTVVLSCREHHYIPSWLSRDVYGNHTLLLQDIQEDSQFRYRPERVVLYEKAIPPTWPYPARHVYARTD
jgi:hypothetical protein